MTYLKEKNKMGLKAYFKFSNDKVTTRNFLKLTDPTT